MFAEYDAPLSAMHHFFEDDPGAVDALVSASRVVNFAHIHMHHQVFLFFIFFPETILVWHIICNHGRFLH